MKFDGVVYDYLDHDGTIREAIVTPRRIAIDWEQGGSEWHLEAKSPDGRIYSGNYGHDDVKRHCTVRFTLFRAGTGELILVGRWWDAKSGNSGRWVFQLTPEGTTPSAV